MANIFRKKERRRKEETWSDAQEEKEIKLKIISIKL
jgi:hypothetical protein